MQLLTKYVLINILGYKSIVRMKTRIIILIVLIISACKSDPKEDTIIIPKKTMQPVPKDSIYDMGRSLFLTNCAACHSTNMDKIMTGPALGGITKKREQDWLYAYVRNSAKMRKEGDSIALALRKEGWALMTAFPQLTDQDLGALFHFIEEKHKRGNGLRVID